MKPLVVLARIVLSGCLWSIIFTEGVRVIMLENWRFDMFWPLHWVYAWNLWQSGWVIDTPKEWAFILIIISFIPLWLTGWVAVSMIAWEKIIHKMVMLPIDLIRCNADAIKPSISKTPVIVKKKSYKEIRPTGHRSPIRDYNENDKPATSKPVVSMPSKPAVPAYTPAPANSALKEKAVNARETFSHSLFNLDNEDDDFDLDFDAFEKSDIFKIDDKKDNKKKSKEKYSDDEDMFHDSLEPKKRKKNNDDNYSSRKFDDEDDVDYKSGRRDDRISREERKERSAKSEDRSNLRRNDGDNKDRKESKKYSQDENIFVRNDKKPKENAQNTEKNRPANPIVDVLTQKGYDIITGVAIKNTIIDFLAVSENQICLCLVDKETGDWLADEERFNNEEPLWFSENSHRISPVRKASLAAKALSIKLDGSDFDMEIKPFVIIQMGNIINAEDMFEIWEETEVEVTRINRGSPKEIKLFSKTVEEADGKLSSDELNSLKKLLRNNA